MKFPVVLISAPVLAVALLAVPSGLKAEPQVVGGITPDRRPDGLPVSKASGMSPADSQRALHGVSKPYPPSLKWLDDQGGWFTPFTHPGMTGPYDIREWHGKSNG